MKKIEIILLLLLINWGTAGAQQIQFTQEKLGTCDSTKLINVETSLFPDTIKWDSLNWTKNGIATADKSQIISAQLGDLLSINYYYNNPVITLNNTYKVISNENILFTSNILNNTRYGLDTSIISLADSNLFSVTNWSMSNGTIINSTSGHIELSASGNIEITSIYNSGCIFKKFITIPTEQKPELELIQTILADPLGTPGTVTGQLSDNSVIDILNGNSLNSTTFNLQLNAGLNTINVSSGNFVWSQQIKVESMAAPNYKIIQTRLARWCDGTDAEVEITTDRGIIDNVDNGSLIPIGNDTANIISSNGDQIFTIYSGALTTSITKTLEKEDDWSSEVYITETKQATCSKSNDAWIIITYPLMVTSVAVDNINYTLQDTLKNLSSGNHQIEFTDARNCLQTKNINIPKSTQKCFSFSEAFTPNGDGLNDIWTPKVPSGSSVSFKVYTYRTLNMKAMNTKLIYEGLNSWDGTDKNTGLIAENAYYIISGTIVYPAYMNQLPENMKEIIKLVK